MHAIAAAGAQGTAAETEEEAISQESKDLAMFVINGECPKCGKIVTSGHRRHLAMCTGKPAYEPTLQELVALEVSKMANLEAKLTELEIGGLIDLTEEGAVFMVVGSTGSAPHVHIDHLSTNLL
jgi:hypothetical protein